jgi:transposase
MPFTLLRERLGPLPLVNHFLRALQMEALLDRHVPTTDRRCSLPYASSLGVLLRSILVEREPIYRQYETVQGFAPSAFGLTPQQARRLGDDQLGRALDRLFDADRGSLLTAVVVNAVRRFSVKLEELHNDSTTIRFCGQYRAARGRRIRGRRAAFITYGHSKDHRPDLKQLLFILTSSSDGGVPVQFRCEDGNTNDSTTHLQTWQALCEAAGCADFLYVADSKLCTYETMDTIDRRRGRFVTVLPASRKEDAEFRHWIQTHEPDWQTVWDRPNPRGEDRARDLWRVFRYPLPSREGWPVIWVSSSLLALNHQESRRDRLTRAQQELETFRSRLAGPRPRRRAVQDVYKAINDMLERLAVTRYLQVKVSEEPVHRFRQDSPGRPGPDTRYRRISRRRLLLSWQLNEAAIAHDSKSDGMYPLLTNDRSLSPQQVLEAHKRQPTIEKRFEQTKTVHEIAPVCLKNEGRIEALFFLYFLALLTQALVERQLRQAMQRARIPSLPLYPEQRACRKPTAEQIFRLFSGAERDVLLRGDKVVQVFQPQFTLLQKQVLDLLEIPERIYRQEH